MPKRKEPELDPKEQFKRFQEAAKQHELDPSGQELAKAFKTIASPKQTVRKDASKDGA